ncbi:MFS transporter, partial [Leucobacter sp. M11]|nr:MFS transporter [Leucobacter sp. M11]
AFVAAIFLIGLGMGIATPGYTAGPTLRVTPEEQGGLAGLIGATNGLTFVLAPTAGTALYALWPPLPILAGAVMMGLVLLLSLAHPALRPGATARG